MPDFSTHNNWPIAADTDVVKQYPTTVDQPFKEDLDFKVFANSLSAVTAGDPSRLYGIGLWGGTLNFDGSGYSQPLDLSDGGKFDNIQWASIIGVGSLHALGQTAIVGGSPTACQLGVFNPIANAWYASTALSNCSVLYVAQLSEGV